LVALSEPVGVSPASDQAPIRAVAPLVSVIIPHYDDLENLRRCIALLSAQTLPPDQFETIVADNNSSCGLASVADACAGAAIVVPAPIQGAGEARNAGVSAARGKVLAFVDSDCRPAPDWLERGSRAIDSADVVGGRVVITVENPIHPTPAEAFEMVFAFQTKSYVEDRRFCVTANMFTRRDVFDRVGAFRTGVSEDIDWGRRAAALGFRLRYADDAIVSHPARRTRSDLLRKWRRTTRESYQLFREQPLGRLRWFVRSWLVLFSPLVHCVAVLRSPELKTFDQRLKALGVLVWLRAWRFAECNYLLFAE
jgi:GT2 family glycosyltransferase